MRTAEATKAFIEHYGVKGMHWGVRHPRNRVSRGKKSRTTYQKPAHRLSDAELQKRIRRMEMEKRYKDLNTEDTKVKKGKRVAGSILSNSGKTAATTIVTGATLLAVSKALQKHGKLNAGTVRAITGK